MSEATLLPRNISASRCVPETTSDLVTWSVHSSKKKHPGIPHQCFSICHHRLFFLQGLSKQWWLFRDNGMDSAKHVWFFPQQTLWFQGSYLWHLQQLPCHVHHEVQQILSFLVMSLSVETASPPLGKLLIRLRFICFLWMKLHILLRDFLIHITVLLCILPLIVIKNAVQNLDNCKSPHFCKLQTGDVYVWTCPSLFCVYAGEKRSNEDTLDVKWSWGELTAHCVLADCTSVLAPIIALRSYFSNQVANSTMTSAKISTKLLKKTEFIILFSDFVEKGVPDKVKKPQCI